jgi:hypothetical protein
VAACGYEITAITTGRAPTITTLCGRHRWLAPAVLTILAVHLYRQPPIVTLSPGNSRRLH